MLLPSLSSGSKEKEVSEFRSLLQTVFSCLKSVLYCMVAFHTNRGLQAPVSCMQIGLGFAIVYGCPCQWLPVVLVGLVAVALCWHSNPVQFSASPLQLSFPVKMWSVRTGDVRVVSRLVTFGLPALAFYEAAPHPNVDMREQFADLFTVLQVTAAI